MNEQAPPQSQCYRLTDQAAQNTAARLLSRFDGLTIDTNTDERNRPLLIVDCWQEAPPIDVRRFVMTVDPKAELIHSAQARRRRRLSVRPVFGIFASRAV